MPKWKLKFCVIVLFNCYFLTDAQDVGDSCKTSGLPGICKLVVDCPTAVESLRKTRRHTFVRCGFDGMEEIICCPNDSTLKNPEGRFIKRKSEQACDEIKTFGFLDSVIEPHIINGEDAAENEFPHMAALGYASDKRISWDCGASIISPKYLLTAAHCLVRRILPSVARLGVTKLNETNKDIAIKQHIVHDDYDSETKQNDIGMILLAEKIEYTIRMHPACLYVEHNDPKGLIVTGWGKTKLDKRDNRSIILQKSVLVAIPLNQCNSSYNISSLGAKFILPTQLCAMGNSTDACAGDSGGPLQIRDKEAIYIVGIISYGSGCAGNMPGVYARVSRYLDYIEKIVWP